MSGTIISIIIMVLSQVLPQIGVNLGNAELTTVVSDLFLVGAGLIAWIRHLATKAKANPGSTITLFGRVK